LFVKGSGNIVETGARIHADGEIAGIVMGDLMETGHVERDVVARRWHANFEFGAMAARDKGELFERRKTHDFGDLVSGGWFGHGGWTDFVNGV